MARYQISFYRRLIALFLKIIVEIVIPSDVPIVFLSHPNCRSISHAPPPLLLAASTLLLLSSIRTSSFSPHFPSKSLLLVCIQFPYRTFPGVVETFLSFFVFDSFFGHGLVRFMSSSFLIDVSTSRSIRGRP